MPIPYNRDHTTIKSAQLQALDCRPTGATKTVGAMEGLTTLYGEVTLNQAVEAGECVAVLRVPAGFKVLEAEMSWTASGADTVIGLGDPFCCGRLLGPIISTVASHETYGMTCGVMQKVGKTADGCGKGYIYTCVTDLVITNGYGELSFGIGGGKSGTANGGLRGGGALPSGWSAVVRVKGQVIPNPNS